MCDSSDTGIAEWICPQQDDGLMRCARSLSRKFTDSQMNYLVNKKELLALVDSVRHSRGVSRGHPVTIVTDHRLLLAFMQSLQTNPILIRWQGCLSPLDSTIEYLERVMDCRMVVLFLRSYLCCYSYIVTIAGRYRHSIS